MKKRFTLRFLIILLFLGVSPVGAQDIFTKLKKLSIQEQYKEQDSLIRLYEKKFQMDGQYDNLMLLYSNKTRTIRKRKGLQLAYAFAQEKYRIGVEHLPIDNPQLLELRYTKARMLSGLYRTNEAIKELQRIIALAGLRPQARKVKASAGVQLAASQMQLGSFEEGMRTIESFRDIIIEENDTTDLIVMHQCLTHYYERTGELDSIMLYMDEYEALIKSHFGEKHVNYGLFLIEKSGNFMELGVYKNAFETAMLAMKIFKDFYVKTNDPMFYSDGLSHLAHIFTRSGEYFMAIDLLEIGLELMQNVPEIRESSLIWNYSLLLETYLFVKEIKKAEKVYHTLMRIVEEENLIHLKVELKGYYGEILYAKGRYQKAIDYALINLEELKQYGLDYPKNKNYMINLIVKSYMELENYDQALHWSKIQYRIARQYIKNSSDIILAQAEVIASYIGLNRINDARLLLDTVYRQNSINLDSASLKYCRPNKNLIWIVQTWMDYLAHSGNMEAYFLYLEEFKEYYNNTIITNIANSTSLLDLEIIQQIFGPGIEYYADSDPLRAIELTENIKNIYTKIILQNKLYSSDEFHETQQLRSALLDPITETDTNNFKEFLDINLKLYNKRDSLINNDFKSYIRNYNLFSTKKKNIEDIIHRVMHKDELVIEYQAIDSTLYIFSYDGQIKTTSCVSIYDLEETLMKYLEDRNTRSQRELFNILMKDVPIQNYSKLLILPVGNLFYLNFEELKDENNQYLVYNYTIRYGYSLTTLDLQQQLARTIKNKASVISFTPGFGSALKEKHEDMSKVDSNWNFYLKQPFLIDLTEKLSEYSDSKAYIDSMATEDNFKNLDNAAKILHIGTHGVINDQSPLFSQLVLIQGKGEDGILYMHELFNLKLENNLVVLSACNTGVSKMTSGKGVISMAHAFTHAGSPATLMTLWEVDEKSTVEILDHFYANLFKGMRKSEALHQAKLAFLEQAPEEQKSPYYWAGLVIIGHDEPIITIPWYKELSPIIWIIFIAIVSILILFLLRNRRKSTHHTSY